MRSISDLKDGFAFLSNLMKYVFLGLLFSSLAGGVPSKNKSTKRVVEVKPLPITSKDLVLPLKPSDPQKVQLYPEEEDSKLLAHALSEEGAKENEKALKVEQGFTKSLQDFAKEVSALFQKALNWDHKK